jgi:hypothetical protein
MTSEVKVWIVAGTSLALAGFCAVSSKLLKKSVGKKTLLSIEPDSLWTAIIWALQFAALILDPVFQLVVLAFCQTLILEAVLDTWW